MTEAAKLRRPPHIRKAPRQVVLPRSLWTRLAVAEAYGGGDGVDPNLANIYVRVFLRQCYSDAVLTKRIAPSNRVKLELCQFDRFTKDLFHSVAPFSDTSNCCQQILPPAARNPILQHEPIFCDKFVVNFLVRFREKTASMGAFSRSPGPLPTALPGRFPSKKKAEAMLGQQSQREIRH